MDNKLIYILAVINTAVIQAEQIEGQYPFRNISLPWEERVNDLVGRLTLEEMVQQMAFGGGAYHKIASVPRLGIKPYNFDTECIHGILKPNKATAFPQSIGLSATFR